MVFRRCKNLLKNEEQALDAMQEVFLNVHRHTKKLTGNSFSSYFYRTATNVCLNIIRREKNNPVLTNNDFIKKIAHYHDLEKNIITQFLTKHIFSFYKEKTITIALLYHRDKLTIKETAEVVNMSVSGVKKHLKKIKIDFNRKKEYFYD